jgi:hypothetical protein
LSNERIEESVFKELETLKFPCQECGIHERPLYWIEYRTQYCKKCYTKLVGHEPTDDAAIGYSWRKKYELEKKRRKEMMTIKKQDEKTNEIKTNTAHFFFNLSNFLVLDLGGNKIIQITSEKDQESLHKLLFDKFGIPESENEDDP